MGTEFVDQAEAALGVAKRDQLFRKQLHPNRRPVGFGELLGQQRGNPVTAEHVTHGCSRTGQRQQVVLFLP